MPGYKARRKLIVLQFEDPEMADLEVKAYSASIGEVIGLTQLSDLVAAELNTQVDKLNELMEVFASKLVAWNIETEGPDGRMVPVPTTLTGLLSLDKDFAQDIVLAWLDGVVSVSAPLAKTSGDGVRELLDSLPMEPLAESPRLLTVPS